MNFAKLFDVQSGRQVLISIDDWDEEVEGVDTPLHCLRMTCWFGSVKATGSIGPMSLSDASTALSRANQSAANEAYQMLAEQVPEGAR